LFGVLSRKNAIAILLGVELMLNAVNINLVAMDGGWKSTATGLSGYQALRHHHNVATMRASRSFMDQDNSELHRRNWRQGEVLRNAGIKVFQIETTVNNDLYGDGPLSVLAKREWEWTTRDRATFMAAKAGLDRLSPTNRRRILHGWRAPYAMTSVQAGEVEAVHKLTTAAVYAQQLVPVEGQTDVLALGLPYICPYNVNSIMNPILVMCLGLGYFFNLYKGRPLVREGGVLIMSHPTTPDFHPVHHPSYIDFFEEVLAESTDPSTIESKFEQRYAEDPWYIHLYRKSYAYHGVHPFYMWYWGAHALDYLGDVIVVGGDPKTCARMGYNLFDSTMPTRDARHGRLLTFEEDPASSALSGRWYSHTYIQDSKYIRMDRPISAHCDCLCCANYSLAYLHHLYRVSDSLFYRLATMHNLRFMVQLMARLRELLA